MTQFCFSSTKNNKNEKKINSSNTSILCSYIFSHTLYIFYLIFFFPYIFKLIFFLSPLFFTTFLLFLSLVTTLIPLNSFINSKDGFFHTTYTNIIEHFRPSFDNVENDENSLVIGGFEVYKVVFDVPEIVISESNPIEEKNFGENPDEKKCELLEEKTVYECEILISEPKTEDAKPEKMEDNRERNEDEIVKRSESKINEVRKTPKLGSLKVKNDEKFFDAFPQTVGVQQNFGSFGSMRKEKEWRRTLACKLFEERHNWSKNNISINNINNINGEECMDLLWETSEIETTKKEKSKKEEKHKKERKKESNNNKNNKIEELMKNESEEYEEYESGKICCLQALKLSAGKMNLSVGSPNLAKFSKVFKGIGWLQTHVKKKSKKRV
ncbi:hypothetical protein RND81_01G147600 [Saponaria officinalis]|uniref:Uncharacterized protein n=1 Tax=Saponaria officinalis TaxID=3572 RepID=A0AAW1N7K8_SAPOF